MPNRPYGTPLDDAEIAATRTVVARLGVVRAAQALGVGRTTLERGLAKLGIRNGSLALIRLGIAALAGSQPQSSSGEGRP